MPPLSTSADNDGNKFPQLRMVLWLCSCGYFFSLVLRLTWIFENTEDCRSFRTKVGIEHRQTPPVILLTDALEAEASRKTEKLRKH